MNCYPPFFPPLSPMAMPMGATGFRNPITPEEYAKMYEMPLPSGAPIGPNTPTSPTGMPGLPSYMNEDMAIANYMNAATGRSGGYIDNLLRLNSGKIARIHMTFNSGGPSSETKVFTGRIETAARDHIVISDPTTGGRTLLLMVYLDYIEFPEEINYYYPGTNAIKIVDESVLEANPEIMPLYNYQKAKKEKFIHTLEAATVKNEQ